MLEQPRAPQQKLELAGLQEQRTDPRAGRSLSSPPPALGHPIAPTEFPKPGSAAHQLVRSPGVTECSMPDSRGGCQRPAVAQRRPQAVTFPQVPGNSDRFSSSYPQTPAGAAGSASGSLRRHQERCRT